MTAKLLKSKPAQLALVLFLLACIIITGSYAWNGFFGQHTVFTPSVAPAEVLLVDYAKELGEVYVVNNTGQEVLVRLRLAQYLGVDGRPQVPGMLRDDPSTWAVTPKPELEKYYKPVFSQAVVSMEQWLAQGAETGDYWVADDDGWFYYAKRLQSGETTRILLQEIAKNQFNELVGGDYGVETAMQAVPMQELSQLLALDQQSFSKNGALLMRYLGGEMVTFVPPEGVS